MINGDPQVRSAAARGSAAPGSMSPSSALVPAPLGDLFARLDDATAIATAAGGPCVGREPAGSPHRCMGMVSPSIAAAPRCAGWRATTSSSAPRSRRWMDPFKGRGDGSNFVGGQPHRGGGRLFL